MCLEDERNLRFSSVMLNNDPVGDELQSHEAQIIAGFMNIDVFVRMDHVVSSL